MSRDNCPICGAELSKDVWLINPPIRGRKCVKCGRFEELMREDLEDLDENYRTHYRGGVFQPRKEL